MAKTKKHLGKIRDDYPGNVAGESIYLSKHSWDCGWYWGFGYIGNGRMHTHFDTVFLNDTITDITDIFKSTRLTQEDWWVLRDLFIQAYSLKQCASVYRIGGHQTDQKGITDIIKNEEMEKQINKDLEIVLNKIWELVENI